MSNPTFTVTVKGQPLTFTSAFAKLDEAYKVLDALPTKSEFVTKLLLAARLRVLSPAQVAWLHKLATDHLQPPVVADLNLTPIVAMMQKAAAAQKRAPRITLQLDGRAGSKVVLAMVMSIASKYQGTIGISNGGPYGDSLFYGRINQDGSVITRTAWTPEVEALLHRLAANPLAVAKQHGVATGNCCFCGRDLSTAESRTAGYGPICASKFGLEWGDTTAADEADKEAKEAFVDPRIVRLSSPNSGDRFQGD